MELLNRVRVAQSGTRTGARRSGAGRWPGAIRSRSGALHRCGARVRVAGIAAERRRAEVLVIVGEGDGDGACCGVGGTAGRCCTEVFDSDDTRFDNDR